jgi:hypothetical protein
MQSPSDLSEREQSDQAPLGNKPLVQVGSVLHTRFEQFGVSEKLFQLSNCILWGV